MMEYKDLVMKLKKLQVDLKNIFNEINDTNTQIMACIESKMYRYSQMWLDGRIEHPEWIRFRSVWNDKYVSEDYTEEMIIDEIKLNIKAIENEFRLVCTITQNDENAIHIYKTTLDFEKATKR